MAVADGNACAVAQRRGVAGIVVVPRARAETVLKNARARVAQEAAKSLPEWERKHRARVENTLRAHGYLG
jgi:regulator of RNase E activity RraA